MTKRAATFWQSVLKTKFRQLNGMVISEVGRPWYRGVKIGIITAWNPFFEKATESSNQEQNITLQRSLEKMEKRFEKINAWRPDGTACEESFAVENLTHGEARSLCRQFKQSAYFWAKAGQQIRLVFAK